MTDKMGRPKDKEQKLKTTFHLTKDAEKKINELYAFELMALSKKNKSDLVCDAIALLYKKVFRSLKNKAKEKDE